MGATHQRYRYQYLAALPAQQSPGLRERGVFGHRDRPCVGVPASVSAGASEWFPESVVRARQERGAVIRAFLHPGADGQHRGRCLPRITYPTPLSAPEQLKRRGTVSTVWLGFHAQLERESLLARSQPLSSHSDRSDG
mmetsp:Transcript_26856/g.29717  ORF Transcript_26856/g.29717 Transcript_26856/m.29717 type:complete len:138 (+) Transcript_26856:897-1310(+)